ncbi:MAG TPA: GlsB/YeaQ/YmgE family stress response membrane protein [Bacillota bacterium]|nr:GlsB/YeaQ/YmgE family stress response membrane protein [Bacillota bacterium]
MSIIAWIVFGGIVGWLASIIAGANQQMGILANIAVGIIGAFLGGFLFNMLGGSGVTGFNIWSVIVAVVGAVILLLILKAVRPHHPTV